jgi:hypothetical protein
MPPTRSELLTIYDQHQQASGTWITISFAYMNFYVGLLSAILVVTLIGLAQVPRGDNRSFLLLVGPALVVILAKSGFGTVRAMYGRFFQQWITLQNIEAVMGLAGPSPWLAQLEKPICASKYQGLLTQWQPLRKELEAAASRDGTAESVLDAVLREMGSLRPALITLFTRSELRLGITLRNAKLTFFAFQLAAVALALSIALLALR